MKRHRKKSSGEDRIAAAAANPLSMIDPTVVGTPLGMLPILPVPSLDGNNYRKDDQENKDQDKDKLS